MAKVYVVTEGSYSDYGIVAIFSSRERAEAYMADARGPRDYRDFNEVEEWEVDLPREQLPGAYQVFVAEDGSVMEDPSGWTDLAAAAHEPRVILPMGADRYYIGYGSTYERARRSAEELRRQTIAVSGPARKESP